MQRSPVCATIVSERGLVWKLTQLRSQHRVRKVSIMRGAFLVSVAAVGLLCAPASADFLDGDEVSIELWSSDFGGISYGINVQIVGAGEDGNFFGNQFYDFNAAPGNIFTIRSTSAFSSIDGIGGRIEWRLTDLNFAEGALIGVNIIQSYSDVSVINLTPTSVTFEYEDIAIPAEIYFIAEFTVIPAPAGLALFGVAGLVGRRRRRLR